MIDKHIKVKFLNFGYFSQYQDIKSKLKRSKYFKYLDVTVQENPTLSSSYLIVFVDYIVSDFKKTHRSIYNLR